MAQLQLMTAGEVAEKYEISRSHLNQLVRAGKIRPVLDPETRGQTRYYTPESIEAYLRSRDPRGKRLPEPK